MTSIGETLRDERLRRHLQLDEISRELKISPKLLEAIESEEFDKLPGTIFAKNFVRQYARLLELDEEEIMAEVQRVLQPAPMELPRPEDAARTHAQAIVEPPPIELPRVEEWETGGERRFSWSAPLPSLALLVVVMLVCSAVYGWYQRTRHPVLAQNTTATATAPETQSVPPPVEQPPTPAVESAQPPTAAEAEPAAAPPPSAPPAASPAKLPTAVPQQSQPPVSARESAPPPLPAAQPAAAPPQTGSAQRQDGPAVKPPVPPAADRVPNGTGAVRLEITADEPAWVMVLGDGKYLFSGTIEAHETRTVEASRKMELRVGNAGAISVTLNGKLIGAVGPRGQVRTVQFTSGGFQIVAAPKSGPLLDPL